MKNLSTLFVLTILVIYGGMNLFYTHSSSGLMFGGEEITDTTLVHGYNELFAAAGECVQCHGHDPDGLANITGEGLDVNQVDGWRSSMMANSARDPFWRAKVSHEVLVNPELQTEIESSCTDCHAPLGFFNAQHLGIDHYGIEDLLNDSIAMDGVSCLACHQQSEVGLASEFSGALNIVDSPVAYGPYESPLISVMAEATGIIPEYSEHISDAGICASCHTLITETVDLDGNITGDHFVEQATYHEWLNSVYGEDQDNVTCQNCHMPEIQEDIVIAAGSDGLPPRNPFYIHELAGGNVHMLQILKNNIDTLNLSANEDHFDKTIQATYNMLQNGALQFELSSTERTSDTAYFEINMTNLAGHKFPSGYPARRLFIEFVVKDDMDNTIFHSGEWDSNYYLLDEDENYEPHYDIIRSQDEVQIYEMVMGDVEDGTTTVLSRAKTPLKDNRLAPVGFSMDHVTYDTTLIAGLALVDDNFNHIDGVEGSGSDKLRFNIPMEGYTGQLQVEATAYYQSIPPKFMEEMFGHSSTEIDLFEWMFNEAENEPILVETDDVTVEPYVGITENEINNCSLSINSFRKEFTIRSNEMCSLCVYDVNGKLIYEQNYYPGNYTESLNIKASAYLFVLRGKSGTQESHFTYFGE